MTAVLGAGDRGDQPAQQLRRLPPTARASCSCDRIRRRGSWWSRISPRWWSGGGSGDGHP